MMPGQRDLLLLQDTVQVESINGTRRSTVKTVVWIMVGHPAWPAQALVTGRKTRPDRAILYITVNGDGFGKCLRGNIGTRGIKGTTEFLKGNFHGQGTQGYE